MRCGITGPLLRDEFEKCLAMKNIEVTKGPVEIAQVSDRAALPAAESVETPRTARVGLISHIGGHKFAGNVVIYLPPGYKAADGTDHALAGCGIWYGRVEPKHVEGIVQETILSGKVIEEMFRGGIRQGGEILRL
jgi:(2Fe-2S) ferredoxin